MDIVDLAQLWRQEMSFGSPHILTSLVSAKPDPTVHPRLYFCYERSTYFEFNVFLLPDSEWSFVCTSGIPKVALKITRPHPVRLCVEIFKE